MKRFKKNWFTTRGFLILALLALGATLAEERVHVLLAQGFAGGSHHASYDPLVEMPVQLPEAYALAMLRLGNATNRFHCVEAKCLEGDAQRSTGWIFALSSSNGVRASVKVFFNKDVWIDPQSKKVFGQE